MALCFQKLSHFLSILILKHFKNPKRNIQENNYYNRHQIGFDKFQVLEQRPNLDEHVLIFNVESTLLRSSSMFPYFMLVAFEASSPIRAFILFLLYPLIILCSKEFALKIMVMICFFGLKKERFREGKAVLPKFFLEDVGMESFEVLRRGKKTVALSSLPQVMVESFLKDYLDIDFVVGKDLKVFRGYFVGLMDVCTHKTLLDPIGISYGTRNPLTAVTYSLSRMSEIISPIKTVRLTRNRDRDAELMHKLLSRGDVVVCPEGTTCREPYLLRFSPLFTEISNEIFPVAMNFHVTMFYGMTASGLKLLDPLFFLMNPWPCYSVRFLDMVR